MVYDAPYEICIERAKYWTESYKETEGQHPTIRAARALEKTLDNMSIFILDQEQIVGHRTSKFLGAIIPVERGDVNIILREFLQNLKTRERKPFRIREEDEELLFKEILPYWRGKTVSEKKRELWRKTGLVPEKKSELPDVAKIINHFGLEWVQEAMKLSGGEFVEASRPTHVITVLDDQGHLVMGHKNILKWGYGGIKKRAMEKLEEVNKFLESEKIDTDNRETVIEDYVDIDKLEKKFQERFSKNNGYSIDNKAFLEAVIICCDASSRFIKRFAALAKNMSEKETNKVRAAELKEISQICDWISTNPPRNFREALQLVWFNQIIGNISHGLGAILGVGRPDQYLYPYYKSDIEKKAISEAKVVELLEEFLIKLSSNLLILPNLQGQNDASELGEDHVAVTVGGVDENGEDAVNELSYLFMQACENVKCMTISFSVRIAPNKNPKEWIKRAVDIYSKTNGPALYNDNVIIPALVNAGVSLEDARDYAIVGCVEPAPQGNAFPITAGNAVSMPGLLEMVLNCGQTRLGGKLDSIEIGDPREFRSYEEIWNKYMQLIKHAVHYAVKCANIKDIVHAENYPNPYISMTLDGCIENALDMTQGGAKYNFNTLSSDGWATVANSLCALKKVVFEDKEITMKEMADILDNNYREYEKFRLKLINSLPKYGNDDDYVDSIMSKLTNAFCEEVMSHPTIRTPGVYRPCLFSAGTHTLTGRFLGATPDGRKAGEAVSNALSPSNGTEKNGPTAVLKSATKMDTTKFSSGMSLNMRLSPLLLRTEENRSKIADLISAYFKMGGMHVQFNVVNQETLIDAQRHPEKYQDLIVRVSGYCAYFVNLGKALQDDIIARCQFEKI